jgi:hypothetical protein
MLFVTELALSAGARKVRMKEIEIPFNMYVWLEKHGKPNEIVFSLVQKEMLKHRS